MIVEDFQVATGRYFAHRRRVPTVTLVTVWALHEDARIAQTLGKHLTTDVVQPYALSDMATRLLDYVVPVDVRQQPKAEPERNGIRFQSVRVCLRYMCKGSLTVPSWKDL